jgi:hypothetical protein
MKKTILTLCIMLLTTQFASALGQTPVTKVKYMSVYPDAVFIQLENKHNNEDGCSHSRADEFVRLNMESEGSKVLYSSVLTSYTTGAKIVIAFDGCTGEFPTMIRMDMIK